MSLWRYFFLYVALFLLLLYLVRYFFLDGFLSFCRSLFRSFSPLSFVRPLFCCFFLSCFICSLSMSRFLYFFSLFSSFVLSFSFFRSFCLQLFLYFCSYVSRGFFLSLFSSVFL